MKLDASTVRVLPKGMFADDNCRGLYVRVNHNGARSWLLRATIGGRRREIGLGSAQTLSPTHARKAAAKMKVRIAEGGDPLADKRRTDVPTFAEAVAAVYEANRPRWRSEKHAADWMATLTRHALPKLGALTVDAITRADVIGVLRPIWPTKCETARRTRQRIRAVLAWAQAHGFRDDNPADDSISAALPPMPKVKAHLRALDYRRVPELLLQVEGSRASIAGKACFKFLLATAARSGEARGSRWEEVDTARRIWTVPAARMKGNRQHRIPLSSMAVAALREVEPLRDPSGLVFPSPLRPGRPLSDMTMTKSLRDLGFAEATTIHGLRASFRTWAQEATTATFQTLEAALSHVVGSQTVQAYSRSDELKRRRVLMDEWAKYCMTTPGAKVVNLHG